MIKANAGSLLFFHSPPLLTSITPSFLFLFSLVAEPFLVTQAWNEIFSLVSFNHAMPSCQFLTGSGFWLKFSVMATFWTWPLTSHADSCDTLLGLGLLFLPFTGICVSSLGFISPWSFVQVTPRLKAFNDAITCLRMASVPSLALYTPTAWSSYLSSFMSHSSLKGPCLQQSGHACYLSSSLSLLPVFSLSGACFASFDLRRIFHSLYLHCWQKLRPLLQSLNLKLLVPWWLVMLYLTSFSN